MQLIEAALDWRGGAGGGQRRGGECRVACRLQLGALAGALDQDDPVRHHGLRPPLFLLGLDQAGAAIGEAEMDAADAGPVGELGQDAVGEEAALLLLAPFGDVVAQGDQQPALAGAEREGDAAERAPDVAEGGGGAARPRRRVVEPVEIVAAGEHLGTVGLVEGEEFRRAGQCDIATAAAKAGNADALRHVLAIVPLEELGASFRRDVVPDRHHALTCETHRRFLPL